MSGRTLRPRWRACRDCTERERYATSTLARRGGTSGWTAAGGRPPPTLLHPRKPPDGQRSRPGDHEEPDDDEAGLIDVEVRHEIPEAAGEVELRGEQTEDLDGPDQHRDRDRQSGDGDVVVDLAHRLGECPAVGKVHERAIERV